jgi:hypothetical protein
MAQGQLESFGEQFEERVPLGRRDLNWRWRWRKKPIGTLMQKNQICPTAPIPVSIVEFRDLLLVHSRLSPLPHYCMFVCSNFLNQSGIHDRKVHDYFGEMEMLQLGQGTDPRAREATTTAQHRCVLSRLTRNSWRELRELYPGLFRKNEETFKSRAAKRGIFRPILDH